MTTLSENLPNRVKKLAKPRNQSEALQPFFEAVSNALMAIDDRIDEQGSSPVGLVGIKAVDIGGDDVEIVINDNGIGLDEQRYNAFLEVDTEFKAKRGGKGVGRLYWLDAFKKVEVHSQFRENGEIASRAFIFKLSKEDQVAQIEFDRSLMRPDQTGTVIRLKGVRQGPYLEHFSKQPAKFKDYLAAEFISDFLSGEGSNVRLEVTSKSGTVTNANFPRDVSDLVVSGPTKLTPLEDSNSGQLIVTGYLCNKKASAGLPGRHQVHLLGNKRTVQSRKVDDLIAIPSIRFEEHDDLALHLIVSGPLLDQNVAESRTTFNIPDDEISELVKSAVVRARHELISDQLQDFDRLRRIEFEKFLRQQPIFGYANQDELFASLPSNAKTPEDFVGKLALPRFRAERKREEALTSLIEKVVSGDEVPADFGDVVRRATEGVQDNERNALAHHAARRRVVLDIMDRLIRRLRESPHKDKNHVENTLHTLLVPMRINAANPKMEEAAAHDLWLLDERLAFASGFSSDTRLASVLENSDSEQRPDIFLWDVLYALTPVSESGGKEEIDDTEPLSTVFIVELKHPGRTNYSPEERIEDQIRRYVSDIKGGKIESFGRRSIRLSEDCQFHCLVVADFEGRLADEVSGWDYIHNRRGRERRLGGDHSKVIIQAVEWDYILSSSRQANRSLLDAAGMDRANRTIFTSDEEVGANSSE